MQISTGADSHRDKAGEMIGNRCGWIANIREMGTLCNSTVR